MKAKYRPAFKAQAVEKALLRGGHVSQAEVAASLSLYDTQQRHDPTQ